ncbi:MAG TPA: hypothetical protein V6D17_13490 [Candidatus Obscuribacterales bacterium]
MLKKHKRENFDVTPEQESEIDCLQELLKAPSRKDAMLTAVRLALHLASEARHGHKFFVGDENGRDLKRLIFLEIEPPNFWPWKYLVEIPHPWKRQLYVKGRKLPAAVVWTGMIVNKLSREEAAENWELPLPAIDEIVRYCESSRELLQMEAQEEGRRLVERGIKLAPKATS